MVAHESPHQKKGGAEIRGRFNLSNLPSDRFIMVNTAYHQQKFTYQLAPLEPVVNMAFKTNRAPASFLPFPLARDRSRGCQLPWRRRQVYIVSRHGDLMVVEIRSAARAISNCWDWWRARLNGWKDEETNTSPFLMSNKSKGYDSWRICEWKFFFFFLMYAFASHMYMASFLVVDECMCDGRM